MMKKLAIVVAIVLISIGSIVFVSRESTKNGLTKVEGYAQTPCLAVSPGCGLCYGEVINNECYVDKKKLTDEQLEQMGLD